MAVLSLFSISEIQGAGLRPIHCTPPCYAVGEPYTAHWTLNSCFSFMNLSLCMMNSPWSMELHSSAPNSYNVTATNQAVWNKNSTKNAEFTNRILSESCTESSRCSACHLHRLCCHSSFWNVYYCRIQNIHLIKSSPLLQTLQDYPKLGDTHCSNGELSEIYKIILQ